MREGKSLCPLCKAEIPLNSTKCSFCGALFVEKSYPFILKGIECSSCGHKNYSYDYCANCKKPFAVVCPMCGEHIALSNDRCPSCGLKRDQFNVVRELGAEEFKRKRRFFWIMLLATILLVVGVLATLIVFWIQSGRAVLVSEGRFENPKVIDTNGDGKPDRIEHFDDQRRLVKIEELISDAGEKKKTIWLNPDNQKPVRIEVLDYVAKVKIVELYDGNGVVRTKFTLSLFEPELVKSQERFSSAGLLIEKWEDKDFDGVLDSYQRFRTDGTVWIDAQDSKNSGIIDSWKFYSTKGKLISEGYDSNGDGIFELLKKYSVSGRLLEERFDKNSDGFPEEVVYYSALGKIRGKEIDTDGDGIFDYFEVYTKKGIFMRKGFDIDADGSPDKWE